MAEHTTDVVVIGGGSTGENVADYARKGGLSVTLVEAELVGGECSYWACMPSKALLRPGEVLAAARRVPAAAAALTGELDVEAALASRDAFTSNWEDDGQAEWLTGAGVDLVRGVGRLTGEREVTVEQDDGSTTVLRATRAVVLATGSGAQVPPIDGLADARPWTSREVTAAKHVPERLLVIGGGVVGVEMAQAWHRLGTDEVTIVEAGPGLLGSEEPFAGEQLAAAFADEGIEVVTGAEITAVRRDGDDGPVTGELADGRTFTADEVLIATGRRARTDDVGLDSVGLEPGGFVDVDDHLRVAGVDGDWLYAAGDVNGRALLTHQGKYQARLLGDHLAGRDVEGAWADDRAVPRVVFTDPQVAAAGLTEAQARDQGIDVRVVSYGVGDVAGGALLGKDVSGTSQLVIATDRQVVVGATFTGPGVGEMLHAATIAIVGEVGLDRLWHAVPAFPTVSEVWLRLLESLRE